VHARDGELRGGGKGPRSARRPASRPSPALLTPPHTPWLSHPRCAARPAPCPTRAGRAARSRRCRGHRLGGAAAAPWATSRAGARDWRARGRAREWCARDDACPPHCRHCHRHPAPGCREARHPRPSTGQPQPPLNRVPRHHHGRAGRALPPRPRRRRRRQQRARGGAGGWRMGAREARDSGAPAAAPWGAAERDRPPPPGLARHAIRHQRSSFP